ncbi:hydantoinase B/oxoprolinase family protein [Paenibacillus xylaniclasticus]|uniref:hydantoinase B/oxoprolinase family protein n=1 Tax=Paenibacillus xylaniclasticus TaxID=588083 RepID=UPI000FD6FED6|nr:MULTISPECIES: hydantoinase B/oxoprolinase family protein [Paenibacillus]GFN30073.1 methylhydantoinase [Paenibacillus curdlanolyticus]
MLTTVNKLDPITAQVIRDSFESISSEISRVVERTAVHPLFQEVHDYSTGVFYYDGKEVSMIARATAIPVHIFASITSVEALIKEFGSDIHEGDVFLVNDPYYGGTHAADWTMMKPVMLDNNRMIFPSVRAHMSDFGGVEPGGYNPSATDVWQEGFRIPPIRLYEKGVIRQDMWDIVTNNSRLSEVLKGDLLAILGGCNIGALRTKQLVEKYGVDTIVDAIDYSMEYAAKRLRSEISKWPDGVYVGERLLDHDSAKNYDIKVKATVTVQGETIAVDFTGTDNQVPGYINSPMGNTASYVYMALCGMFPEDMPVNSGMFRQVKIYAPEGTVVNPLEPAPVMFSTVTIGGDIGEAVMNALAKIAPERAGQIGQGYCLSTTYGTDSRYNDEMYFTIEYGNTIAADSASYGKDGWGGWSAPMCSLILATIETQELQFPFLYRQYEYANDSVGHGQWRGVPSFQMKRQVYGDRPSFVNITTVGNRYPLQGFAGGHSGARSYAILRYGTDEEQIVKESATAFMLEPNEVLFTFKGGGGGWGSPYDRDIESVLGDVMDGYVSVQTAKEIYGVVITEQQGAYSVDHEATASLRQQQAELSLS